MTFTAKPPYQFFTELDGTALEAGKIYIGTAGLDAESNPISAYWDEAGTIAAAQPIRTIAGVPDNAGAPSDFFVPSNYSISVKDKNDVLVYSKLNLNGSDLNGQFSYFGTIAEMALADFLIDGQAVRVTVGFNGEPEDFTYDSSSALTADGALVVDATGMGAGRLISTRTIYADYTEANGDFRTFDAGSTVTILGVNGTLTARTGAGSWGQANAGGQNFDAWSLVGDVRLWGVDADANDNTAALLRVAEYSRANAGSTWLFQRKTYFWDGSNIAFGDAFTINGNGATLKLIAGDYSGYMYGLTARSADSFNSATPYSAGVTPYTDIRITGLKIDGNKANVTTEPTSFVGMFFYRCASLRLADVSVFDTAGDGGGDPNAGLPGIDFFFCDDVTVDRPITYNTHRQGLLFWETTGFVRQGSLGVSRIREPALVSTNDTVAYQASKVEFLGTEFSNAGTVSGTHVVRFSGQSYGSLRSCILTGDATLDGLYVTSILDHNILMEDCDIYSTLYGLRVETDGPKSITSRGNRYHDCQNPIRWLAAGARTRFQSEGDDFRDCVKQPLYVAFCEDVEIKALRIKGGDTAPFIGNFKTLDVDGYNVTGMTPSYILNVSGSTQTALPNIRGVKAVGNTSNTMNLTENALATDCAVGFGGAGISLGRIGTGYIWRDNAGKLRTNFSEPAKADKDTAGVIIGTQTA